MVQPETLFSFGVLENFHAHTLSSKKFLYDYHDALLKMWSPIRRTVGGLSAMGVGMLSASYLPGRFRALTVSSFFSVVSHFSTQKLRRLYLRMNRVNLSIWFFYFFLVRGRKATYVICHPQMSSAMPLCYLPMRSLANPFQETSDQKTRLVHFHGIFALSTSKSCLFSISWSHSNIFIL